MKDSETQSLTWGAEDTCTMRQLKKENDSGDLRKKLVKILSESCKDNGTELSESQLAMAANRVIKKTFSVDRIYGLSGLDYSKFILTISKQSNRQKIRPTPTNEVVLCRTGFTMSEPFFRTLKKRYMSLAIDLHYNTYHRHIKGHYQACYTCEKLNGPRLYRKRSDAIFISLIKEFKEDASDKPYEIFLLPKDAVNVSVDDIKGQPECLSYDVDDKHIVYYPTKG